MRDVFKKYIDGVLKLDIYQYVGILSLIIVISGVFGWVYEFIFYYFNGGMKEFYMQGGNFLPWINIYAIGSLFILFLSRKYVKKPLIVFLISFLSTGILEYLSGFLIYKLCGGLRLWDYNVEILNFGNIGGFVCLRSVLFFGVSGLILMYFILPICIYLSMKIDKKVFFVVSVLLCSIILFDEVYNLLIARVFNLARASDFYKSIGWNYVDFNK